MPADYQLRLTKRMNELAVEHPRYGYRTVATLLRGEGWNVNTKRVLRLWRLAGNRIQPRRKSRPSVRAHGSSHNAGWRLRAKSPNHIWGMDFMSAKTRRGGEIRILNVVDEFTRLALGCLVEKSIGTTAVLVELERLFQVHGKAKLIRCDNGKEFVSSVLKQRLAELGVAIVHIEKGQPQQNCYVERFNGTMRSEKIDLEDFDTVLEARVILREWAFVEYNEKRPHRGHGMMTPRQFAQRWSVVRR